MPLPFPFLSLRLVGQVLAWPPGRLSAAGLQQSVRLHRRFELDAQLLPAMATPDSGDHLSPFVVIGADGEMPRCTSSHMWFATALTFPEVTG